MNRYTAFGLTIASELTLPGWRSSGATADAQVRFGDVPLTLGPGAERNGIYEISDDAALQVVPHIGRFWISKGEEIVIAPDPEANEIDLRLIIGGTAITALIHQRGLLALHASAVAAPSGVVAFAGHVGAGKSTLATACVRRGWPLVTDDLCVIGQSGSGDPIVYPGPAQVRLTPESLLRFAIDEHPLPRVHALSDKRFLGLADAADAPRRLRAVCLLSVGADDGDTIVELAGVDKLTALQSQVAKPYLIPRTQSAHMQFWRFGDVARRIDMLRLGRSRQMARLDALVDRLELGFGSEREQS